MPSGEIPAAKSNQELFDLDVLIIGAGFGEATPCTNYVRWVCEPMFSKLEHHLEEYGTGTNIPARELIQKSHITNSQFLRYGEHGTGRRGFLGKDVSFSADVVNATFDTMTNKWSIKTRDGRHASSKYLICASGSSYRRNYPVFMNIDSFKGEIHHSSHWLKDLETKGKRVAIIGTGATGVQIVQELSKTASHLTVFQRTAAIALPMGQRTMTAAEQDSYKSIYKTIFLACRKTGTGLGYDTIDGQMSNVSVQEREKLWEELWYRGGFNFQVANYRDYLVNPESSDLLYEFWKRKVRARISNPAKREVLAPGKAPFPIGTKRSTLEQDYYESLDQDHVEIVDMKANPLRSFTENGIICEDGMERAFDIVILATGYDAMTGRFTSMGFHDKDGVDIKERWKYGVFTYLGMCISRCPNLWMIYGPQAPTAFTNGPIFVEMQVDFVADMLTKLREEGVKTFEAQRSAEEKWKQDIQDMNDKTLFPLTDSWYMGANVPGKKREQLNYIGGVANHDKACRDSLEGWKGFDIVYEADRNWEKGYL